MTQIRREIGSRTFLEPVSLLVLAVPLMFVTSVATAAIDSTELLVAWLLANVFALGVVAALILTGRSIWLRLKPSFVIPFPLTVAIAGAIGFLKSFLTVQAVVSLSGLEIANLNLENRLLGGTLAGIVTLLSASAALVVLQRFQAERTLLISAKSVQANPLASAAEQRQIEQLSSAIDGILKTLRQNQRPAPKMEARILRDLVERYVRPLSSSLFSDAERNYQSFAIGALVRSALQSSPPALALGLNFLISTPRNIEWLGALNGFLLSLLGAISIYLVVLIFGWLSMQLRTQGPISFLTISILSTLGSVLLWVRLLDPTQAINPTIIGTLIVWSAQSSIIFGVAKVALQTAATNRREVRDLMQLQDADAALAILRRNRRQLANQMHGEVQSRLMNLVLASEAGAELESKVVIAELEVIQQLIGEVPRQERSIEEALEHLVETWSGFADIEVDIAKTLPAEKHELVFALIEEGVGNAIRHGLANQIKVSLDRSGALAVEDNGMGPRAGKRGLGSRLFDAGGESWSLTALDRGGARLEVQLKH